MDKLPFDPYDFFGYLASGFVLVLGLNTILGLTPILGRDLKAIDLVLLVLVIYVAGQIVAGFAKTILEEIVVGKILKKPAFNLFREHRPFFGGLFFPGYFQPLPTKIQSRINSRLLQEHTILETGETRFLQVRYCDDILNNDKVIKKLDSFRDKYGFNRNLSFSAIVIGLALLFKARSAHDIMLIKYSLLTVAAGLILFYRYLKFFRQYSYEMFNCYGAKAKNEQSMPVAQEPVKTT